MPELNRRATLRTIAGVTAGATALASPTTAKTGKQSDQATEDRPDLQVINNRNEAVSLTIQFRLNSKAIQEVNLQLAPNESRTISKVELPKTGVYSANLQMDGKTVDSSQAEAPKNGFPPYLSVHMDVREQDAFVTTSEV